MSAKSKPESISITSLKAQFSEFVEAAARGKFFVVTRWKKPIATLSALDNRIANASKPKMK
jgi:antitoxin (DNA-binding transcriptional repressor) of toxin-antitoxin stability system